MAGKPKIVARFSKSGDNDDVEVHVRRLEIGGLDVVEVRDYFPRIKSYGRGLNMPASKTGELIRALQKSLKEMTP